MRQEVSVRSEELLVDVEWEVSLTQRSPTWRPDALGFERPEKTGVRISCGPRAAKAPCPGLSRAHAFERESLAITGVRPVSSERAIAWFLTLVVVAMAAALHFKIFPELHALRAAASKHAAPAYPPSAVELDCFEAASRAASGGH